MEDGDLTHPKQVFIEIDPWMTSGEYLNMIPHTWQIDKYKKKRHLQDFIYGIPEYIMKL